MQWKRKKVGVDARDCAEKNSQGCRPVTNGIGPSSLPLICVCTSASRMAWSCFWNHRHPAVPSRE